MIDQKGEDPKLSHKGDLLSLASHELRTTLSIVKWYTEMLLDGDCGPLNDDQIKYLKTIEASNQRGIDLIKSLLNVSRLDLGTFCINPTDTDIRTVIQEAIEQYTKKLKEKNIRIVKEYDENAEKSSHYTFLLDKQITLVLLKSLLSNAITFSKNDSEIHIAFNEVNVGKSIGGGSVKTDSFVISVKDNGIGIPKVDQGKVFTKLFKASNAGNVDENGGGLSLYIVHTILSKIGGGSWFQSEENVGTTFYIAIPRKGMPKKEGKTSLD